MFSVLLLTDSGHGSKTSLLTIMIGCPAVCAPRLSSCAHDAAAALQPAEQSWRPLDLHAFNPIAVDQTSHIWIDRLCSMMRKEGDITFNGAPPNKNMKRNMGFVMQVGTYKSILIFKNLQESASSLSPASLFSRSSRRQASRQVEHQSNLFTQISMVSCFQHRTT